MEKQTIKPWGSEVIWAETSEYVGKLLFVKAGHRLSLQYHTNKSESILITKGRIKVHWQPEGEPVPITKTLLCGDNFDFPAKLVHRIEAIDPSIIIEISTPGADDIVRLEDDYGRVKDKLDENT